MRSGVLCVYFPPAETFGLCHQVPNLLSLQWDCNRFACYPCLWAPAAVSNTQWGGDWHQPEMCLFLDHFQQVRLILSIFANGVLGFWMLGISHRRAAVARGVKVTHICLTREKRTWTSESKTGSQSKWIYLSRWIILTLLRKKSQFSLSKNKVKDTTCVVRLYSRPLYPLVSSSKETTMWRKNHKCSGYVESSAIL
jgi:hypothetical protein